MKGARIGIMGGTGGMGRWFADFLKGQGCAVETLGKGQEDEIPALARRSSVVVVSVPIHATIRTIERVGPHMREDAVLMDLTSVKAEPVKRMLECSRSEVIGLHPLFGPGVVSLRGENVAVCPARGEKWLPRVRALFLSSGVRLVETTPERHDEMMSFVQVLTHLCGIMTGLALGESGIGREDLLSFSTPAFRAQLGLVKKIFGANPRLYADILSTNPGTPRIMEMLERNLSRVKAFVEKGDAEGLTGFILSASRSAGSVTPPPLAPPTEGGEF